MPSVRLQGTLAATVLALSCVAGAAHAQTQIDVAATLRPSCVFDTDMNFRLELQQHLLPAVGDYGPDVGGKLVSAGCEGVSRVKLTFLGAAVAEDPSVFAVDSGGAQGVGVHIRTDDGRDVVPNDRVALEFPPLHTGESYGFKARFRRTGDVTPGGTRAKITIGFDYD